jgi:uncharacterized OB-fold protein
MTDEEWAFEIPGKLEIPFRYFAGAFNSRFLTTLRDEKKIMACRCPTCGKVFMPPRSSCEVCFTRIEERVQVGPAGVVTSWTVVRYSEPHLPDRPPYILALIKLDGADTALAHIIKRVKPEEMKTGMRVEPVFAKERKASITDIAYFKPARIPAEKPAVRKKAVRKKPAKKKIVKKTKKKVAKPGPKKKTKPKKKVAKKTTRKKALVRKRAVRPRPGKKAVKKTVKKKPARKKIAGKKRTKRGKKRR